MSSAELAALSGTSPWGSPDKSPRFGASESGTDITASQRVSAIPVASMSGSIARSASMTWSKGSLESSPGSSRETSSGTGQISHQHFQQPVPLGTSRRLFAEDQVNGVKQLIDGDALTSLQSLHEIVHQVTQRPLVLYFHFQPATDHIAEHTDSRKGHAVPDAPSKEWRGYFLLTVSGHYGE